MKIIKNQYIYIYIYIYIKRRYYCRRRPKNYFLTQKCLILMKIHENAWKSASQPASQPAASQPTSQPASQPTSSQPASQPSQPASPRSAEKEKEEKTLIRSETPQSAQASLLLFAPLAEHFPFAGKS